MSINAVSFGFDVAYPEGTLQLTGYRFDPVMPNGRAPIVFNSGFTGGVSMYGQLIGHAFAELGYQVFTYDVTGFFTNRDVRNTKLRDGKRLTRVSLEDQTVELMALIDHARVETAQAPALLSWAMGGVASMAALHRYALAGQRAVSLFVPMNYSSMRRLQMLRKDPAATEQKLRAQPAQTAIAPFDLGDVATEHGFYPLDANTQNYVQTQLGAYTDAMGMDHWPGVQYVTAESYCECLDFDPLAVMPGNPSAYPAALIVHGAENTLHTPFESLDLQQRYPNRAAAEFWLVRGLEHGQQLTPENSVFQAMVERIDGALQSEQHGIAPAQVQRIEITTFHQAIRLAVREPITTEQAQYSTAFPVASALAFGKLGPAQIREGALTHPEVLRLSRSIRFVESEEFNQAFPANRFAQVALHLVDGRVLRSEPTEPAGDPENPVQLEELRQKFVSYSTPVIGAARARALEATVLGWNGDTDMGQFKELVFKPA